MKSKTILSILVFLLTITATKAQNNKEVIGYFANWQIYARGGVFHPQSIDYSNYTILNYSFFTTDTLGNISGVDDWADSLMLRGAIDWGETSACVYKKHILNRLCSSLGG
jgi:GH18 family chitinase